MFGLFGRSKAAPAPLREPLKEPLPWRSDATFPIPEWEKVVVPESAERGELDHFWSTAAFTWLNELRLKLGDRYAIAESEQFMLLGALPERQRQLALEYAEKTRSRVLHLLAGIASDEGYGKFVMLVLHDHDAYYEYITNYYTDVPDADELAFSSGMYINHGYGHFVFVAEDLDRIEPVIAHELTHSLLAHLPLPAWVNEGIAVNTERRLCASSLRRCSRLTDLAVRPTWLGRCSSSVAVQPPTCFPPRRGSTSSILCWRTGRRRWRVT